MDLLVALWLVAMVGGGGWLWWRRRASASTGSSEVVDPPAPAPSPTPGPRPVVPEAPPTFLTREALLHRDRVLDPSRWDNTPDAGGESGEPSPMRPPILDRESLRRRADQE